MKKERSWTQAPEDELPENKKITQAGVENWNDQIAIMKGFEDMLPESEADVFFHVAVGRNSEGMLIGAKLLSKKPAKFNQKEHWLEERDWNLLESKAKQVFGLAEK